MIHTNFFPSPLGDMLLAERDGTLIGCWFVGQKYYPELRGAQQTETAVLRQAKTWLGDYFAGKQPSPSLLPLNPEGSEFRRQVWEILCTIPYGQTVTYGQIAAMMAEKLGKETMSAQAVGGAVGHNPISVIIPCHRVVGSSGQLTGYAGGLERKAALLKLEKSM